MMEIWELISGRQQHKAGKDGGDLAEVKGCSTTDDD
jgi:hypothetical protein